MLPGLATATGASCWALAIVGLAPRVAGDLHGFNVIFWLAAIPGVLSALSIVVFVKESPHPVSRNATLLGSLQRLPPSYRRYLAGVFIFGCGDFSHTMLILYAVQSLGPLHGASAGAIAIQLYALHNALYAVGSYPAGLLADRYGKRPFLLAAYGLAAAMNLVLIVMAPSALSLILVFALAGAGYALQQSLERAICADITPLEARSTGFGALAAANGVGDLVSSAVVGALWTMVSPKAAFAYALVLTIAGGLVTAAALRRDGEPASR